MAGMAATCNLALCFFVFLLLYLPLSRDLYSSNDQERASGAISSGFSLIPVAFLRNRFRSGTRREQYREVSVAHIFSTYF